MKNLKLLSLICFLITIESCTKKEHSCQSRKMLKEHSKDVCYDLLPTAGVCGWDGKTYKSECEANKNGMSILYSGPCK
jgi:hypothetical protein